MLKDKVIELIKAVPFLKHLTYKICAESVVTFFYESKRYSKPIRLRSFHRNNFDIKSEFYMGLDEIISRVKSDYYYVDNKPIIIE